MGIVFSYNKKGVKELHRANRFQMKGPNKSFIKKRKARLITRFCLPFTPLLLGIRQIHLPDFWLFQQAFLTKTDVFDSH